MKREVEVCDGCEDGLERPDSLGASPVKCNVHGKVFCLC